MKYCGSITAHSLYPVIKYWESTAAGCLTFMEMTERNDGKYLGFKDNDVYGEPLYLPIDENHQQTYPKHQLYFYL